MHSSDYAQAVTLFPRALRLGLSVLLPSVSLALILALLACIPLTMLVALIHYFGQPGYGMDRLVLYGLTLPTAAIIAAAMIDVAYRVLDGGLSRKRTALSVAFRRSVPMTTILLSLAVAGFAGIMVIGRLLSALLPEADAIRAVIGVALVVPGFVVSQTILGLALFACVVEGLGAVGSVRRAFLLVRGRWLPVLAAITLLASMGILLSGGAEALARWSTGAIGRPWAADLVMVVISLILNVYIIAFVAVMYRSLSAVAAGGDAPAT